MKTRNSRGVSGIHVVLAGALSLMAVLLPDYVQAQDASAAGVIRGTVRDQDFGDPLSEARVTVQELGLTGTSEAGGVYRIENLPEGVYTLTVAKSGYIRAIQRDVIVRPGQVTDANLTVEQEVYELEPLVVQAEDLLGGSDVALLELRQDTSSLMDAVGSDLIGKAGASDAGDALKLVVGATVSSDDTPTVRGLGDRYTVTTLNMARVPSSNPVKRAVELDQFPTSVIDNISVSKTFLPDMQGEATGGQVNIVTKAVPDGPIAKVSASTSYDSQATGNGRFRTYEGAGEALTFDIDGSRDIPVNTVPTRTGANNAELAAATTAFDPVMGTTTKTPGPDQSYSISLGNRFDIDEEQAFGILFNMRWSQKFNFTENAREIKRDVVNNGQHSPTITKDLIKDQGVEETSANMMFNLGYQMDKNNTVQLLLLGNTVAEDTAILEFGPTDTASQFTVEQSIRHRSRLLATAQLRGDHTIESLNDSSVNWIFASSLARQYDPDTRIFNYEVNKDRFNRPDRDRSQINTTPNSTPTRSWQRVEDVSHQGGVDFKYQFDTWNEEKKPYIKFGPYAEALDRRFVFDGFEYGAEGTADVSRYTGLFLPYGPLLSDIFFDPTQNTVGVNGAGDLGWFLRSNTNGFADYNADQLITALYLMGELPITDRLVVTGGVRFERTEISIAPQAKTPGTVLRIFQRQPDRLGGQILDATPEELATSLNEQHYHPAISLSYEAVDDMFFRIAYSKTTARPTFRELAPTQTLSIEQDKNFVGNPGLVMSESDNYDFRWEWFPRSGSVLAFSAFHKSIENPIETITVGDGNNDFETKENFESGRVTGFELEARTSLGVVSEILEFISIGGNYAYIDSRSTAPDFIRTELVKRGNYDPEQPLAGTPEFLANLNLSYDNPDTGTSAAVFWNWEGETLLAGQGSNGGEAIPASVRKPFDTLNMSISQRIYDHVKLGLQVKNILNRKEQEVDRLPQGGDVLFLERTKGVDVSLGLSMEW